MGKKSRIKKPSARRESKAQPHEFFLLRRVLYFWATAAAQTLVAIVKKLADLSILSLTNWYGLNQKLRVKVECSTVVKLKESRGFESLEKKQIQD